MIENLKSKKQVTNIKIANKGITLIALVITIIVLLILAGVTIATLTGDNGILNQAGKAKDKTTEAESIERVQVEVAGSYGLDGKIAVDQLNKNLKNINGLVLNGASFGGDNLITSLPATVTLNGYDIEIDGKGNVSKKITVAEAKTNKTVFGDNKTVVDDYGNSVTIPKGFKIADDSATDVTGGIVIEDATYPNTMGSQFVWIAVSDIVEGESYLINTPDKTTVEIKLGRYVFDSSGNIDTTLSKTNPSGQLKISETETWYFTEGLRDETTYYQTHAKDIEAFINSAKTNHGYYIGRYEARKSSEGNLTVVGTDNIYNNITQPNAATESRNMYDTSLPFTSDLMNSFAWDTAIVFEQEFDNRTTNKTKKYSRQNSLNTGDVATTGTNNLTDTTKQDKICNIWDMASNYYEWTTETYSASSGPCVFRGGYYDNASDYTSRRNNTSASYAFSGNSFRPLLYL